jgi:signal transduction histidine kinase
MKYVPLVCGLALCLSVATFAQQDSVVAKDMVKKAAALIAKSGVEAGLAEINKADGQFVKGELYVFAYDTNAVMLAHPKNAKLIGKNLMEIPDVDGKLFRKEIVEMAKTKKSGWVDYKYKNPETSKIEAKTTFLMIQGSVILCCGIYK